MEALSNKMTAKNMLPFLLQPEARLKVQGSSEKDERHAAAYAAKRSRDFASKKGRVRRELGKLGELLLMWWSLQDDGVQSLQGD